MHKGEMFRNFASSRDLSPKSWIIMHMCNFRKVSFSDKGKNEGRHKGKLIFLSEDRGRGFWTRKESGISMILNSGDLDVDEFCQASVYQRTGPLYSQG